MRPLSQLLGARIRRIDAPSDTLFALTLAAPGYKGVLVVSLSREAPGIGLVADRPRGERASAFVQKLRKELEGARIDAFAGDQAGTLELHVARGDGPKRLVFAFAREPAPNLEVVGATETVCATLHAGSSPRPASRAYPAWPESLDELEARGQRLLQEDEHAAFAREHAALARAVSSARKRLARKLEGVLSDAARAEQAPELRARATLLMANLAQIPRGAARVALTDYTRVPEAVVDVALDPALSAREQAQAWFQKAKRFERGAELAAERVARLRDEQRELEQLQHELAAAQTHDVLAALAARAKRLGAHAALPAARGASRRSEKPAPRVPYREFLGHAERKILVGRGAGDNDALTLHHARSHDLWLHARDTAGAHVVVPLSRDEACPPELLRDAALLAAHFSSARGERKVDVTYTPRRYVSKPRGAATGSVRVEREKVMCLDVDERRLQHLLASETRH